MLAWGSQRTIAFAAKSGAECTLHPKVSSFHFFHFFNSINSRGVPKRYSKRWLFPQQGTALPTARNGRRLTRDLPAGLPYGLQRAIPSARGPSTPPSLLRIRVGCWNINQLSIGLALRLILRTRLTLNRLSLFRKPWSSGGKVSHLPYRYLCLHLLFQTLQRASRPAFGADWNAPLPISRSLGFGTTLIPVHHPCSTARLVSCYALFKCMAASKPTS